MLESFLRVQTALHCLKDMVGLGGLAFPCTYSSSGVSCMWLRFTTNLLGSSMG